jgi:hypothetical protein
VGCAIEKKLLNKELFTHLGGYKFQLNLDAIFKFKILFKMKTNL